MKYPIFMLATGLSIFSSAGAAVDERYLAAIEKTAEMATNAEAQKLAERHGLQILNLTWEDTGRFKDSAVGPNISDMTIQVGVRKGEQFIARAMPVIRFPNFSDKTADLDPRNFTLLVGNEKGKELKRVSLYDFLENPTAYLANPNDWKAERKTLLAPNRDSKVLVSAQACFLPIPRESKATFNPVLFNYQSYKENPAVLTILATREGTSTTIIDNVRDPFESGAVWGQRLFFNNNGQRASITGERESDFRGKSGDKPAESTEAAGESGLNMVLLIQVPLKYKPRPMPKYAVMAAPAGPVEGAVRRGNVENAVIGHGDDEGPFTELDGVKIERDERFPVRVTVQFYKATDNGVVSEEDIKAIADQIERVYRKSDYVGSLVTAGETGRITEYDGVKVEPPGWWDDFWARYEENTGIQRKDAERRLREILGEEYQGTPVSELYLRNKLREK